MDERSKDHMVRLNENAYQELCRLRSTMRYQAHQSPYSDALPDRLADITFSYVILKLIDMADSIE